MTQLKRTSLYDQHLKLKARMVPFGGWDMPVQYSGVIQEHEAVRTKVGLFDVSHMGEFLIEGPEARTFLQHVTTNDVEKLYDGRCQYTILCYDNGTVVDDLIISQIDATHYIAVVNASNIQKDFDWLKKQNRFNCQLTNVSDEFSLIAVQGPNAEKLVQRLVADSIAELKYYHFRKSNYKAHDVRVFRTGYTGEDGFELMIPNIAAAELWNDLLKQGEDLGVQPIGLGARDTLRLEAAYSLYGHEINDSICPIEAKLGWVISFDKSDYIGKAALLADKENPKRLLYGFEMIDAGIARDGYPVKAKSGQMGFVTSGTHSPTLKKSIGLALIGDVGLKLGDEIEIDVRGKLKKARLVKTPFYKREKK